MLFLNKTQLLLFAVIFGPCQEVLGRGFAVG